MIFVDDSFISTHSLYECWKQLGDNILEKAATAVQTQYYGLLSWNEPSHRIDSAWEIKFLNDSFSLYEGKHINTRVTQYGIRIQYRYYNYGGQDEGVMNVGNANVFRMITAAQGALASMYAKSSSQIGDTSTDIHDFLIDVDNVNNSYYWWVGWITDYNIPHTYTNYVDVSFNPHGILPDDVELLKYIDGITATFTKYISFDTNTRIFTITEMPNQTV